MVQLETVVDVVGTVGEGTEVAMVGMLAPTTGLALTLLCPELPATCVTKGGVCETKVYLEVSTLGKP